MSNGEKWNVEASKEITKEITKKAIDERAKKTTESLLLVYEL
jgi:hypothetical protein